MFCSLPFQHVACKKTSLYLICVVLKINYFEIEMCMCVNLYAIQDLLFYGKSIFNPHFMPTCFAEMSGVSRGAMTREHIDRWRAAVGSVLARIAGTFVNVCKAVTHILIDNNNLSKHNSIYGIKKSTLS